MNGRGKDPFREAWDDIYPTIEENKLLMKILQRLRITNIVATVNLNVCNINLSEIAKEHPFCNYHRGTFAAMGIRIPTPKCSALIYPAGVMVCMGTQSDANTFLAAQKYVEVLNNHVHIPCQMTGLKMDNYVCSVYTFALDLENGIKPEWTNVIEYDKDKFPGAIVRCKFMNLPIKTKAKMAFFRSGKMNITGACTLYEALFLLVCVYYKYLVHMRLSTRAASGIPLAIERYLRLPVVVNTDIRPAVVEDNTGALAEYNQTHLLKYLEVIAADRRAGHKRAVGVNVDQKGNFVAVDEDGQRRELDTKGLDHLHPGEKEMLVSVAATTADLDYDFNDPFTQLLSF